jgi:hypothetical protein
MNTSAQIPPTLRAAVALLIVQAVTITAIMIFLVYADLTATGADQRQAWAVTGMAIFGAVLLSLLAWGVARARRWARDIAVAVQLTLLAPAYYMVEGGMAWLAVIVGGIAIAIICLLVVPATNRALGVSA